MSISLHHDLKVDEWTDFVSHHPLGNVFHTKEMFQVFANARGYQPEIWVVKENGEILSFMMPTRITLANGIFKRLTSRYVAHGSILCDENARREQALSFMLKLFKETGYKRA